MNKKILFISFLVIALGLFAPVLVLEAIEIRNPLAADTFAELITNLITFIFQVALVLAPLMIIIGAFYFFMGVENIQNIETGKKIILWTIIGFVIIMLARGMILFLERAFEVDPPVTDPPPITDPVPDLHVTPTTITASLVEGTGWTDIGTVSVDNIGIGTLSWSATVGTAYTAWLEVVPPTTGTTGTEIDSVTIQATTAGLAVRTHTGTINFTGASPATGSPDAITVTLTVTEDACGGATTLTDPRDGRTYAIVAIGTQCWMAENLNFGTMTAGINQQGSTCATVAETEKYCYGDIEANCNTDGALYQWHQAMCGSTTPGAQGICPPGWHIPTDAQFKTLEMHLGMTQAQADATGWRGTTEGDELKSAGLCQGRIPCGTSGWNGLLAGTRDTVGSFRHRGSLGYVWSSSPSGSLAWSRLLHSSMASVGRWEASQALGFSVRCIKN